MNLMGMLANARPEGRRIINSASFRIRHFFWNLSKDEFLLWVGELRECHLGKGLPEQSWGWERVVSADTGADIIQINIEKKLEVDEAERYRKPIPSGKNPSVSTHQFRVGSPALKHSENGFKQTTLFNSSFWSPALLQISALLSWLFLVCLFVLTILIKKLRNNLKFIEKFKVQCKEYFSSLNHLRVSCSIYSSSSLNTLVFFFFFEHFSFCKEHSPILSQWSHQNQEVNGDNITII